MTKKVKIYLAPFGLPTGTMILGFILSGLAHYYIAPYLSEYIISTVIIAFAHRKYLQIKKQVTVLTGPAYISILVEGMPDNFFTEITKMIAKNQKIIIECPSDQYLRAAIADKIIQQSGQYAFKDSDLLEVSGKPLDKCTLILNSQTREGLQKKMTTVLSRGGWSLYGDVIQERNSSYLQTVVYEPKIENL